MTIARAPESDTRPLASPQAALKPRRPWLRWLLILVLLLFLARRPILQAAGSFLVVDESESPADYVLILDADRGYEHAANLYHAGSFTGVVLIETCPNRLERTNILPTLTVLFRQQLRARRVPDQAVTVLPGEARNDWETARLLGDWLRQHPGERVTALCHRFNSRRTRYIFDTVLGAESAPRVSLRAIPQRGFDETSWWQSKAGLLDFFDHSVGLGYVLLAGEDPEWREWDADAYERETKDRTNRHE